MANDLEAYSNRDSSANLGPRRGIVKISETSLEKGLKVSVDLGDNTIYTI